MKKTGFLIALIMLCGCFFSGGFVLAEERASAIDRANYNINSGTVTEETDRITLNGNDAGMGYKIPMDANAQVDIQFSLEIEQGDNWACIGFMLAPQSAHVAQASQKGISVMLRNASGVLRADVYVCLGGGRYDPEKTTYTTNAVVGQKNTLSLRRSGSEYSLYMNNRQIVTNSGENPVKLFFSNSDFLTADGMTYACFGQYRGSSLSVYDISFRPAPADASNWSSADGTGFENTKEGLHVTADAICGYDLDANHVALTLSGIDLAEGNVTFGLGAEKEFGRTPGVLLALSESEGEAYLAVSKQGADPESFALGVSLSELTLLGFRNFGDCYRVEANGVSVGFAQVLMEDFSKKDTTYLSVSLTGGSSVTVAELDSSTGDLGKGDALDPRNWQDWKESVEERDSSILLKKSTALNTSLYANYASYSVRFENLVSGRAYVSLFATAALPSATGGARGMMLEFVDLNGRLYVNGYRTAVRNASPVFSSFDAGDGADGAEVTFKAKTKTGMVLLINGKRVTVGGEDAFDRYAMTELASASGRFFFGVGLEGEATAELFSANSQSFDPNPEVTIPDEVVPEGALGMDPEDWKEAEEGSILVNEGGTLDMYKSAMLTTPLNPDYVGLRIELQTLSDTEAQDAWLTFALCSNAGSSDNASPDGNLKVDANTVLFMFKNTGGMLQMGIFYRYNGTFNSIQGLSTFRSGVAGTYTFELVYFDSELTLYVNGEAYTDASGANPLANLGRANFADAEGNTYLGFCSFSAETSYTGRNARRWTLLGIDNEMPAYFAEQIKRNDYVPVGGFEDETPDESWRTACLIAAGASLAAGIAAGVGAFLIIRRRKNKGGEQ